MAVEGGKAVVAASVIISNDQEDKWKPLTSRSIPIHKPCQSVFRSLVRVPSAPPQENARVQNSAILVMSGNWGESGARSGPSLSDQDVAGKM